MGRVQQRSAVREKEFFIEFPFILQYFIDKLKCNKRLNFPMGGACFSTQILWIIFIAGNDHSITTHGKLNLPAHFTILT